MENKDLLKLFKYYRGEENNPFIGKDTMKAKWWEGEKMFFDNAMNDPAFLNRVRESLEEACERGTVSGYIADNNNPVEKRTLVFYLDLWNGKNYPYDSLDDIFEYIRT